MQENRITYKGPRRSGPTKTREEIEISVADGDEAFGQLLWLFENLGFRPIATIRKRRTPFHLSNHQHHLEVTLDQAEGLGDFAEIESMAASESDLPAAQAAVLTLAKQLGLTEVELKSYLRMMLDGAERPDPPDCQGRKTPCATVPGPDQHFTLLFAHRLLVLMTGSTALVMIGKSPPSTWRQRAWRPPPNEFLICRLKWRFTGRVHDG